jgi:hypothetical protein
MLPSFIVYGRRLLAGGPRTIKPKTIKGNVSIDSCERINSCRTTLLCGDAHPSRVRRAVLFPLSRGHDQPAGVDQASGIPLHYWHSPEDRWHESSAGALTRNLHFRSVTENSDALLISILITFLVVVLILWLVQRLPIEVVAIVVGIISLLKYLAVF